MPTIIASLISGVSGLFTGIFNWKKEQTETVKSTLDLIGTIDGNDAKSVAALANSLQVVLSQGSFLERNWRSWLMVGILIMLFTSFFGYTPPHFNDPLSPQMERMYSLLEIGLGGYIARRGLVDIVKIFNIGSILKTLINKKVL